MNVFKRAKEAVMNFFGMNNKKGTDGIKLSTKSEKQDKPNSCTRISHGSNMVGYTPRLLTKKAQFEVNRNKWKNGGTISCFRNLRVA